MKEKSSYRIRKYTDRYVLKLGKTAGGQGTTTRAGRKVEIYMARYIIYWHDIHEHLFLQ